MFEVREDGNFHLSQSAHLARLLRPSQVREQRVSRCGDDDGVDGGEFLHAIGEGDDLRRANESEIQRVEEQNLNSTTADRGKPSAEQKR